MFAKKLIYGRFSFNKKIDVSSEYWSNLVRKKISDLSVEQIINRYNGFEGDLISLTPVKRNKTELEEAVN